MKKSLMTTLIWCFLTSLSHSTENIRLTGKILDEDTNEPIIYANILHQQKSTGTFSDQNGAFTLLINNGSKSDIILISHIGYETMSLTLEKAQKIEIFKLKPNKLEEIIITSKSKFKLKPFIRTLVKTYNDNRKKDPHIAIAYYNEKAKKNNEHIMFMESIGYSVFSGKIGNVAVYSNYKFFFDNSRAYVSDSRWLNENKFANKPSMPSAGNNLRALRVLEHQGILSKAKFNTYNFSQDSTYYTSDDRLVRRIHFKGKGENGFIDVYNSNYQILSIEYKTNNYFSALKNMELKAEITMRFNYFNDTPYLSMVNSYYNIDQLEHYCNLKIINQKFDTLNFSEQQYWNLNRYNNDPYLQYDLKLWDDFNIDNSEYKTVYKQLKSKGINLDKKFSDYTQRWLSGETYVSELSRRIIEDLKENF
ncbi:carboxypeptidase-like regulatory domain-containing protein [Winogradskyella immobilis]|uniref:Carboxypeptidase-like regulatory domain-containing protein n=1 Tax=Winogradskyella immobilis TaxID=2816852 RepID=A0ABS8EKW2_9FLAO|nr:carboxypeptidase-like regulatory domain-containing protein [Winogradskyella immobilis]MCC1483854.1 carboxypeptidase-like regulatory domain-containing protein [Winogradskyella immobilis]MCG0015948.1 carboxypeptidase-like regulatory domain-containing protein [Winogradskyella immobilis]